MRGGKFLQDGNGVAIGSCTREFVISLEPGLAAALVLMITNRVSVALPEADRVCYLKSSPTKSTCKFANECVSQEII
jgi:hypothetical protein